MAIRRSLRCGFLLVSLLLPVLTACGSTTHSSVSPMMGGANAGNTGNVSPGTGMMSGGPGYRYSRLTCQAPNSLPGHRVTVTLADMGLTSMMSGTAPMGSHMLLLATPATVPAGQVSLVAENMGWRTHELVVLPLAPGARPGERIPAADGKVSETGSLGEASGNCAAGTGEGIAAAAAGWTTLTLAPGRYELICNLANHYADGMHQELVVS